MRRRAALGGCAGALVAAAAASAACASRPAPNASNTPNASAGAGRPAARGAQGGEVLPAPGRVPAGGRVVRVALAEGAAAVRVSAAGAWALVPGDGGAALARGGGGELLEVQRRGDALRALGPAGGTSWRRGALVLRPASPDGLVAYAGRRYRGELWLHPAPGGGVTVVDRLPAEAYLRGVLPLELEGGRPSDAAALEAQAVAARSYVYSRLAEFLPRAAAVARAQAPFDLRATVSDQVYGGAGAERPQADRAILATEGLVLRYEGAIASAPYHSACGGSTAAAEELWGAERAPYLRAVSDRAPGGGAYCDIAPRYTWTRAWDGAELEATLARYLRQYAARDGLAAPGPVGSVRGVEPLGRTPSGRTAAVAVTTDAGRFVLRGNGIRYALRGRGGDILPSTYFSASAEAGAGRVTRLVVRGGGNGHGVGMCQWGAVGRARAGQDFRTILRTYYPGTTVEPVE